MRSRLFTLILPLVVTSVPSLLLAHTERPVSSGQCERLLSNDSRAEGPLNLKAHFRLQSALEKGLHQPTLNPHLTAGVHHDLGIDRLAKGELFRLRVQSRWDHEAESVEVEISTKSSHDLTEKFLGLLLASHDEIYLWTPVREVKGFEVLSWRNIPADGEIGFLLSSPANNLYQRRFLSLRKIDKKMALVQVGYDVSCDRLSDVVTSATGLWKLTTHKGQNLCRVPALEFRVVIPDDADIPDFY